MTRALAHVVIFVAALAVAGCSRSTTRVPVGAPVRHDDFTFVVTGVERTAAAHARQTIRVRLEIHNEALRVGFDYRPEITFVEDGAGRRFEPAAAESTPERRIEAGETEIVTVGFSVPADATGLRLGYSDGTMMGDVFDGFQYAAARVPLGR